MRWRQSGHCEGRPGWAAAWPLSSCARRSRQTRAGAECTPSFTRGASNCCSSTREGWLPPPHCGRLPPARQCAALKPRLPTPSSPNLLNGSSRPSMHINRCSCMCSLLCFCKRCGPPTAPLGALRQIRDGACVSAALIASPCTSTVGTRDRSAATRPQLCAHHPSRQQSGSERNGRQPTRLRPLPGPRLPRSGSAA